MRKKSPFSWSAFWTTLLLTELLVLGSMGCFITGFDLQVVTSVFWAIGCMGLFATLCFSLGWDLWLLTGVILYSLWGFHTGLLEHLGRLFLLLGKLWNSAYGWDIGHLFQSTDMDILQANVTQACLYLGILLSTALSGLLYHRKSLYVTLPLSLLFLLPTLVAQDTVPAEGFILLLLLGVTLLLLSQAVRRYSPHQLGRQLLALLLPVTLAVSLLLVAIPQDSYQPPSLFGPGDGGGTIVPSGPQYHRVRLDLAGPKNQSTAVDLTIRTDLSGFVYLRGAAYDTYNGLRWTDEGGTGTETLIMNQSYYNQHENRIFLKTTRLQDVLYTPYYVQKQSITNGRLENEQKLLEYEWRVHSLKSTWPSQWHESRGTTLNKLSADEKLTALPKATQLAAQAHLAKAGVNPGLTVYQAARAIGAYVSSSAQYDIRTGRMPILEDDFALWFLEDSETGYCVHFATAAVVLLRAAGIEARYVEGYLAYVPQDSLVGSTGLTWVEVQRKNAHAWAEYYLPGMGWMILEATPSGGLSELIPTQPTTGPTNSGTRPTSTTAPTVSPGTVSPGTVTAPTGQGSTQTGTRIPLPDFTFLKQLLAFLGCTAAFVAVLALQWLLRLRLRHWYLHRGTMRQQALAHYRHALRLSKLCKLKVAPEVVLVAQRAKFSQHSITRAELAVCQDFFAQCTQRLRKGNTLDQFLYRVLLALY